MTENQQIEKFTAEKFIVAYNEKFKTNFFVKEQSDYPDIVCEDKTGSQLNLEITLAEDREDDIVALLGKSEHKNLEHVRKYGMGHTSALSGNVADNAYKRILAKMSKDYGKNVALVVRDVSPLDWDWDLCLSELTKKLKNIRNPFDEGVWILTTSQNQNKIFRVLL